MNASPAKVKINVPTGQIGIFVSGGLDSALLYHLILKENKQVVPLLVFKNNQQYNYARGVIQYLQDLHQTRSSPVLLRNKDIKLAIREAIGLGFTHMFVGVTKELEEFLIDWEPNNFKDTDWVSGPFKDLDKSQVIQLTIDNRAEHLFSITHTCAAQAVGRCNVCNRCRERSWGFSQLGLTDPGVLQYYSKMLIEKYNYAPISRESIDGKRHYCLPDGTKVPSVTTILDKTKSAESRIALANWRKAVGEKKAQEITTEAASRGTRMHKWLETYVKEGDMGLPGTNPFSKQSHGMANVIIFEGLGKHVTEYWGVEVPVYYSGLYAGTTDCIGLWKGRPAIMDFKQTNKPKKREYIEDYFLQLAAYALAHNSTHGTDIKTGVILMCSANNEYQEFEIEQDEFEHYTQKWLERVEWYYLSN